jgi:hypothetical protein
MTRWRTSIASSCRPVGAICSSDIAGRPHGRNGVSAGPLAAAAIWCGSSPGAESQLLWLRLNSDVDLVVTRWVQNASPRQRWPDGTCQRPRRALQPVDAVSPRTALNYCPPFAGRQIWATRIRSDKIGLCRLSGLPGGPRRLCQHASGSEANNGRSVLERPFA